MSNLASCGNRLYSLSVAETAAIRASRLEMQKADNRQLAVFFRLFAFARLFQWRGLAEGTPSGVPVTFCAGPRTPKPCACHHRFAAMTAGFETAAKGGRPMRQVTAHSEQPHSQIEIIRDALRAAALALTVYDALDVTGVTGVTGVALARLFSWGLSI
jgi:hypothetical protein